MRSRHLFNALRVAATLTASAALFVGCQSADKAEAPAQSAQSGAASAPASQAQPAALKGAPAQAKTFFVWPQEGAKVFSTFPVAFGVSEMTIVPAGEALEDPAKGHHHLLIDTAGLPQGQVVPTDETHIHYGKGQTHDTVTLAPGEHTLTLQFADGAHLSYGPQLASQIKVEVVALPEPAPRVFFKSPQAGAKVKSPVKLEFGVEGMEIRPAGEAILDKTVGHHHVIINGEAMPAGVVVPADETHIHYGLGQTEAELELKPGKHTLTMQFADGLHASYGPSMAATIEIEVEE